MFEKGVAHHSRQKPDRHRPPESVLFAQRSAYLPPRPRQPEIGGHENGARISLLLIESTANIESQNALAGVRPL